MPGPQDGVRIPCRVSRPSGRIAIIRSRGSSTAEPVRLRQPGLTWLLLINAIEVAISDDTSVMLPGTIIVLLVLASDW